MKHNFRIKTLEDGRAMLNLGCGTKMNWSWTNLDFSPYARLAHHMTIARMLRRIGFLSDERYERLLGVDPEIILWDLRKGIPFPDESFDVVYQSHLLEHIDRDWASSFLKECYRALKRGGIVRIVVPDLQVLVNRYVFSISKLESTDESALNDHQRATHDLCDQMVRKGPTGTRQQQPRVRAVERFLRGDTGKTGELHRWMYDSYSLGALLSSIGFEDVREEGPFASRIDAWSQYNLDSNDDGTVHKPGSLYYGRSEVGLPETSPGNPETERGQEELPKVGHSGLTGLFPRCRPSPKRRLESGAIRPSSIIVAPSPIETSC